MAVNQPVVRGLTNEEAQKKGKGRSFNKIGFGEGLCYSLRQNQLG